MESWERHFDGALKGQSIYKYKQVSFNIPISNGVETKIFKKKNTAFLTKLLNQFTCTTQSKKKNPIYDFWASLTLSGWGSQVIHDEVVLVLAASRLKVKTSK